MRRTRKSLRQHAMQLARSRTNHVAEESLYAAAWIAGYEAARRALARESHKPYWPTVECRSKT